MPKPGNRSYSRYSSDAAKLLGLLIRRARIARQITAEELAQRAGLSRGLVHRIEKGDLGASIGAVFEAAAVVGVRLFDQDQRELTLKLAETAASVALLPQAVRTSTGPVKDDF